MTGFAGHPNTGVPSTYEAQDQINYSEAEVRDAQKHEFGNVAGYMDKDKNRGMNQLREQHIKAQVDDRYKHDPTYRATMHGNEPSRGAKIDAELEAEESELLKKKREKTDSLPGKK
ncbi:hypothetical protein GGR57DRAFT_269856 [Xylariaceae sp. FL1272]|nr:hypothetical protein GGR57DRAFT_269856 [Xylariaceae sp. FL1272]